MPLIRALGNCFYLWSKIVSVFLTLFLIQGSLEEWLQLLRLEDYFPALLDQGYHTVDDVTQLTWEDLEEFGIVKLGHQKKIMLAIKRVKDIKQGKRLNTTDLNMLHTQQV